MRELTIDNLASYVRERRHVSVIELKREFNAAGDYWHECAPNCLDMINCSKDLIEIVGKAVRANKIQENPTTPLVYFVDGEVPSLPVAKRPTKKGYAKKHWIPVVFDIPTKKVVAKSADLWFTQFMH